MKKEAFKERLQQKLTEVPLETRKSWSSTDLFVWWSKAKVEDPYLTWDRCPGDVWQWVPGMCKNLYGENANW